MDNPIAKKEHFAEISVKQALEAGAHYIDADDVRDLIGEYERALESNRNWGSSLRSQLDHNVTVNGMVIKSCNALRDSNNELKQQLAEARLALDSSEKLAAQFEQESTRLFALTNKQAHLLTQTGMALRCYEQEPVTTSELHDLPGRAAALRSQLDCALHAIEKRQEQEAQSAKPEFPKRTMVSDDGRPLVKPAKRHNFVMDSIARVFAMVKDREK